MLIEISDGKDGLGGVHDSVSDRILFGHVRRV